MPRTPSPRATGISTWAFAAISTTASTTAQQAEPRLGIAYNIKPSNTVLRVSYARTLETPVQREPDPFQHRLQRSRVQRDHGCLCSALPATLTAQSRLSQ